MDLVSKLSKNEDNSDALKKFLEETKKGLKVKIYSMFNFEVIGTIEDNFYSPLDNRSKYIKIILKNGTPYCIPYNHIKNFEIL